MNFKWMFLKNLKLFIQDLCLEKWGYFISFFGGFWMDKSVVLVEMRLTMLRTVDKAFYKDLIF